MDCFHRIIGFDSDKVKPNTVIHLLAKMMTFNESFKVIEVERRQQIKLKKCHWISESTENDLFLFRKNEGQNCNYLS
jgi:hypothetical protein